MTELDTHRSGGSARLSARARRVWIVFAVVVAVLSIWKSAAGNQTPGAALQVSALPASPAVLRPSPAASSWVVGEDLTPSVHGSSICVLPDGDLATVWYGGERAGLRLTAVLGALAFSGAAVPLGEFTLWRWLMSAHANPSVLFVGFLAAYVGTRLAGKPWLTVHDRLTAYFIACVVGGVLYGSATGYWGPDLYAWARESGGVVVGAGALAAGLIALGNRIGVLLVVALAAHVVDLIESDNVWDYLIDPFFWLLSIGGLVHSATKKFFVRPPRTPRTQEPAARGQPMTVATASQAERL